MKKNKYYWFGILMLGLFLRPFQCMADTLPPETFPSLQQAQTESDSLEEKMVLLKAGIEKNTDEAAMQIKQRYAAKLDAIETEQQDGQETEEEFKLRQAKERSDLSDLRDKELAQLSLTANKQLEQEVVPIKARIKALNEHIYLLGPPEIEASLGIFNQEKQQFTVSLRSKISEFQLSMSGAIPMPEKQSSGFQQQWQAGAITPQAKVKFNGDLDELSLTNSQDNSRLIEINSLFYTRETLKTLPTVTLNALFKRGKPFKDCRVCPDMLVIPAGSFEMGSNETGTEESPRHFVTIKQPFALGKTEITQGEWKAVMGTTPSYFKSCGADCPVESVSWDDAEAYVKKLSAKTGKEYRLPTEAEWEYACRAGEQQGYCGGSKAGVVSWYYLNSAGTPHPVAQKQANAWGLYDMGGNVWEWVEDGYHDNYEGAPGDGSAWLAGGETHVMRGGAWNLVPELVRATVRSAGMAALRDYYYGFRVARTLP